jgi:hypothetical protein
MNWGLLFGALVAGNLPAGASVWEAVAWVAGSGAIWMGFKGELRMLGRPSWLQAAGGVVSVLVVLLAWALFAAVCRTYREPLYAPFWSALSGAGPYLVAVLAYAAFSAGGSARMLCYGRWVGVFSRASYAAFVLALVSPYLARGLGSAPGEFLPFVHWLIRWAFFVDCVVALAGYLFGSALLGARTVETDTRLSSWAVTLACYPPFNSLTALVTGYPHADRWELWLQGSAWLYVWGGLLVVCIVVYAWATVALGFRFGHLAAKGGVVEAGPYRLFPHPAYLFKNVFWWLQACPWFLAPDSGLLVLALAGQSWMYWQRARAESSFLMRVWPDEYAAYRSRVRARWWFLSGFKGRLADRLAPVYRAAGVGERRTTRGQTFL